MDRRTLLAALAGGAAAAAGCLGSGSSPDPTGTPTDAPDGTQTATGTPTGTPTDGGDTPRITARAFERRGDCPASEAGSASIAWGDAAVTVTGCITGKNGCMQASLKSARYDATSGRLTVVVETVKEGGDVCTQQIVHRAYEARVEFAGGLPSETRVVHESMGDRSEAARASRSG